MDSMIMYDVVVAGGGPAGLGAAIGAGRSGKTVALIERHPYVGGMGTAALVNNFCNAHKGPGNRLLIGGVFQQLRQRLIDRKAIYGVYPWCWMEAYNPQVFIEEANAMVKDWNITPHLGRSVVEASFGEPTCLALDNGQKILAKTVIDATGDAAIAAMAGVPFTFGREVDHAVMPLTYGYVVGPIDLDGVRRGMPYAIRHDDLADEDYVFVEEHPEIVEWIRQARESGELTIPRKHIVSITSVPHDVRNATVNFGRVFCKDPTNPEALARASREGEQQVHEAIRFYRKYLPGFENATLVRLALQIGVRESRQIVGQYTLTAEDVVGGRQFEDVIAQCCYGVDIHEPGTDQTTLKFIGGPGHYDIPLRALIPVRGPKNLIVAGRCIAATHEAMSSFRVAPSVMAIGEAAGVSAALAAKVDGDVSAIPAKEVQQQLRVAGGILD